MFMLTKLNANLLIVLLFRQLRLEYIQEQFYSIYYHCYILRNIE